MKQIIQHFKSKLSWLLAVTVLVLVSQSAYASFNIGATLYFYDNNSEVTSGKNVYVYMWTSNWSTWTDAAESLGNNLYKVDGYSGYEVDGFKFVVNSSASWSSATEHSNCTSARTSGKDNCLYAKDNGWGIAPPYAITIADNSTTTVGSGAGTSSSNPYHIKAGTTIKVKVGSSSFVSNVGKQYEFYKGSTCVQSKSTTSTYSYTTSASGNTYELYVIGYSEYSSSYSAGLSSSKIYYKTDAYTATATVGSVKGGTVTVDSQTASSTSVSKDVVTGTSVTFTATANTGYAFKEWNTSSDGTGTKESGSTSYSKSISAATTLYAIFTCTEPGVTTGTDISNLTSSGVTISGSSYTGGTSVTEVGYVYGTSSNPTGNETKCSGTTFAAVTLSGLTAGTTYHYRAYVKSQCGTTYGDDQTFKTLQTYYVAGNGKDHTDSWCDKKDWDAMGSLMSGSPASVTFSNVATNSDLEFKVTTGAWSSGGGTEFAYGQYSTSSPTLLSSHATVSNAGSDDGGNIKIATTAAQNITIYCDGEHVYVKSEDNCTTPTKSQYTMESGQTATYNGSGHLPTISKATGAGSITKYYGSTDNGSTWTDYGTTGPVNAGTYKIKVAVDAGSTYCSASGIVLDNTFTINRADQSALTFEGSTQCQTASVTLSASGGSSGETITYAVKSGSGSITDGVLTASAAGDVVVTATRPGGDNYNDVTADATFTFDAASVAGSITGAGAICSGTGTTLGISGNTGSTYQWQSSTDNETFTDIQDATEATYATGNLTATTYYKVKVTNGTCSAKTSDAATVSVKVAPTVTASAASAIASTTATLNGSYTSNGTTITEYGFGYRKVSDDSYTWKKKGTTTSDPFSLGVTSLTANTRYQYIAYAIDECKTNKSTVQYFWTLPSSVTVTSVYNEDDAVWSTTFADEHRSAVLSSGLTGDFTYQWYGCDSDGSNPITSPTNVTLANAKTATCTATFNLPGTYYFKLVVTSKGDNPSSVTSNVVTVNVPYPVFGIEGPGIDNCEWNVSAAASRTFTQDPENPLKWTKVYTPCSSNPNGKFVIIQRYKQNQTSDGWAGCYETDQCATVSGNTLNVPASKSTVTNNGGFAWDTSDGYNFYSTSSLTSSDQGKITVIMSGYDTYTVTLEKVCNAPTITADPSTTAQSVCKGATATALSVTATGTNATYQWFSYTDAAGETGETAVTEATTANSSYTPATSTVGTLYYRCKVTACSTTVSSDPSGAVTVKDLPSAPVTSGTAVCSGTNATVSVTSKASGATIDWYDAATAGTKLTTGSDTYTISDISETTTVYAEAVLNGCSSTTRTSAAATLKNVSVTMSPATVHPYEVTTFSTSPETAATEWTLTNSGDTAYLSTTSGASTILKAATGTYTVGATANGCTTNTAVTVVDDPDNCK